MRKIPGGTRSDLDSCSCRKIAALIN